MLKSLLLLVPAAHAILDGAFGVASNLQGDYGEAGNVHLLRVIGVERIGNNLRPLFSGKDSARGHPFLAYGEFLQDDGSVLSIAVNDVPRSEGGGLPDIQKSAQYRNWWMSQRRMKFDFQHRGSQGAHDWKQAELIDNGDILFPETKRVFKRASAFHAPQPVIMEGEELPLTPERAGAEGVEIHYSLDQEL